MIDMTPVVQRDLTRVPTPSGLWLRAGTTGFTAADDGAFRAAPDEARFSLLVGAPGETVPTVSELVEVIGTLPASTRARLVLTVYGTEPSEFGAGSGCLAQRLADALVRPVRAHHGLLLDGPDGLPRRTAVDPDGRPSWQPFAQLSTYRSGQIGATVDRWRAPFPGATVAGPGSYRLTSDWTVDVVPAGLVVRPAAAVPDATLRCAPTDPLTVDLVVDTPNGACLPDDMLTALGRLADALPTAARSRLRVVVTERVAPASVRALRWAVPAPQLVWS